MTRASKNFGAGAKGKGDGRGAMAPNVAVPENKVLSNRDKAQHSESRGQDAKWTQIEQLHNSELNQTKK